MRATAILLSLGLASCQTSGPQESESPQISQSEKGAPEFGVITDKTILPQIFSNQQLTLSMPGQIILPSHTLRLGTVTRTKADMREGPGSQYRLQNTILPKGSEVVLMQRLGVWQKVYIPSRQISGWLHSKTLGPRVPNAKEMQVAPEKLPAVTAMHRISKIYSYPQKTAMQVDIPRGYVFVSLHEAEQWLLVLIRETQSLAWVKKEHVQ